MPNPSIEFNTGRFYASDGQPIVAVEIDGPIDYMNVDTLGEQRILFYDKARDIAGELFLCRLLESDIMDAYDRGNYICISKSAVMDAIKA